ncbi:MAG: hypothetical protein QM728_04210 [Gordonia sp. (in: high G+C Gram-positive bacteria)]|uniref:hypothetical protein n=1 Tax=Gordonia sp. (in: high G+C Gram-positive bacteria) TaxID=84139 RepID=UPI0039E28ECB
MTKVTKRGKNSVVTRAAVVVAVVLGLGVGGVTLAGVFGNEAKPAPVSRGLALNSGSLGDLLGPQPAEHPRAHQRPGAKKRPGQKRPGAKRPGQKSNKRSYRVRNNRLPGVGGVCGKVQANRIRTTGRGTVVCAHMGSGRYKWVRINGVDPQVRKPGAKCTGQYITARSPRGKAMQCARGRWTYNG